MFHQIMPINRHWHPLQPVGRLSNDALKALSVSILLATGNYQDIAQYIDQQIEKKVEERLSEMAKASSLDQAAATSDRREKKRGMDLDR